MKNKRLFLGILVTVLVFGMSVVGCDKDPSDENENENKNGNGILSVINGTWVSGGVELKLNNGNYEQTISGFSTTATGTYTVSGNRITLKNSMGMTSTADYLPNEDKIVFVGGDTFTRK